MVTDYIGGAGDGEMIVSVDESGKLVSTGKGQITLWLGVGRTVKPCEGIRVNLLSW